MRESEGILHLEEETKNETIREVTKDENSLREKSKETGFVLDVDFIFAMSAIAFMTDYCHN